MSNPNNICNNPTFLNMLDQKRRNALNNIPFSRYNNIDASLNPYLQINPSTNATYTKFDLDMRRKAEILTYSGNRSARFTNNLTKKELWSQLVKGSYQQRTYSAAFIAENTLPNGTVQLCPSGTLIYTPTTASDVPGSVINLYNDPNVPVYNLVNDVNSQAFAVLNTNIAVRPTFQYTIPSDIELKSFTTFTSLFIYNTIESNSTFSVRTPISIKISDTMTNIPATYVENGINVSINNIYLNVLYSTSRVIFKNSPKISIVTLNNGNKSYTNTNPMTIRLNMTSSAPRYSLNAYLGVLHIDSLKLPTLPGFIYDIQLAVQYNITKTDNYNNYFPNNTQVISTTINSSYNSSFNNGGIGIDCSYNPITVDSPYPELNVSLTSVQ